MSSIVAELDANLQALRALKPPGVTKSKIAAITALCIENVASESVLVQKIYTHFKRTPATHKLGVLYVVDSVTRQWVDKARVTGEELTGPSAPDGTFAAGVHRMTELLPAMMNDLIQSAPDDQSDKTGKLVDIWERGNTFPASMLSEFKAKLVTRSKGIVEPLNSTSRPPHQTATGHIIQPLPVPSVSVTLPTLPKWNAQTSTQNTAQQAVLPAGMPLPPNPQMTFPMSPAPAMTSDDALAKALESVIPLHIREDKVALQQQLQILQQLHSMNVPKEQWPAVIAALNAQQGTIPQQATSVAESNSYRPPQSGNGTLSNAGTYRPRSRSPSRRIRDSPDYTYSGQGGSAYRQRSPIRDQDSSQQPDLIPLNGPKWTDYDPTLPPNHIKVLSRTLFIGGATCTDAELREIFNKFGKVQTVIAQQEKRHAFIKMCSRNDAVNAREKMENNQERVRSTRWGVGFGPRDCFDYTTGISIVPIERLTEADKKWALTAEFGGTGGKPLTSGLVIEEPDIEIGAGVSSKVLSQAMSRRTGPGHDANSNSGSGGHRGRSGGGGGGGRDRHSGSGGHRNRNNNNSRHQDNSAAAAPAYESDLTQTHHQNQSDTAAPLQVQGFGYGVPGMLPQPQNQGQMFPPPGQMQQMQLQMQQMAQLQQQQQQQQQPQQQPNMGMGAPGMGTLWR